MNLLPQRKVTPGQIVMMAVLFVLLTVTVVWASGVWVLSGDTALPYRAWTALILGTAFSVVVGCGLMALMFYSSRQGYDERALPRLERDKRRPCPARRSDR